MTRNPIDTDRHRTEARKPGLFPGAPVLPRTPQLSVRTADS